MTDEQYQEMLGKLKAAPTDRVVELYSTVRDRVAATKQEMEAKLEPLLARQGLLATALLAHLNEAGASSIKTGHGTVYTYTKKTVTIVDAQALWAWAKEHDASEIYQKRVTLSEVEARNEANPDAPVAGLHLESIKEARVRAK